MTRFMIAETPLPGLVTLVRHPISDTRGYLERLYCHQELAPVLQGRTIQQINRTLTARCGTVRGMHYQHPPHAEMKFVSCLKGAVFDVAVDVRQGSPTFLHWYAEHLTEDNHRTLVIPEGFAHGLQTLTEDCELLYLHTAAYNADAEGALNVADPRLAITWPLPIAERSGRDQAHALLADIGFMGITV